MAKPHKTTDVEETESIHCLSSANHCLGSAITKGNVKKTQQDALAFGIIKNPEVTDNSPAFFTRFIAQMQEKAGKIKGGSTFAAAVVTTDGKLNIASLGDSPIIMIVRAKNPASGKMRYISCLVNQPHHFDRLEGKMDDPNSLAIGEEFAMVTSKYDGQDRIYAARKTTATKHKPISSGLNMAGAIGDKFLDDDKDKIIRNPDVATHDLRGLATEVLSAADLKDFEIDAIDILVASDGLIDFRFPKSMGYDLALDASGKIVPINNRLSTLNLSTLRKEFDEYLEKCKDAATSKPLTFAKFILNKIQCTTSRIADNMSLVSCAATDVKENLLMMIADGHNYYGAEVANIIAASLFKEAQLELPCDLKADIGCGVFGPHIASYMMEAEIKNSMTYFTALRDNIVELEAAIPALDYNLEPFTKVGDNAFAFDDISVGIDGDNIFITISGTTYSSLNDVFNEGDDKEKIIFPALEKFRNNIDEYKTRIAEELAADRENAAMARLLEELDPASPIEQNFAQMTLALSSPKKISTMPLFPSPAAPNAVMSPTTTDSPARGQTPSLFSK